MERTGQFFRGRFNAAAYLLAFVVTTAVAASGAVAAPFAAMVIDARSGEVLHAENADARLHPASLTKMMTLYIAFEAVKRGEISLDTQVRISQKAAAEPPSKLGLRSGQQIAFRYLIRAASVKSANDAATAIGEAIEGSEAAFARRMNRTAQALGMTRTTFRNAHGLTEEGHLSTARDMTLLGRHLFYDYPEYYNLFSRQTTNAGIRDVSNTNRRFLSDYPGADGIKTGYTNAAGFNLVASAQHGQERIIATVFGERSTPARNAKVASLLDLGFEKAATQVAVRLPAPPNYAALPDPAAGAAPGMTVVKISRRPMARPLRGTMMVASADGMVPMGAAGAATIDPRARPEDLVGEEIAREVVTRLSTSGGRHFGINVGKYGSRYQAERVLLKTALVELGTLDDALRKVVHGNGGYEANFVGMTQESAALACRRLAARDIECSTINPG